MEWMPSEKMNTVDLKAVIASWGLYAPHGAEKPELRTFVSDMYREIMAERVKHTSMLVHTTGAAASSGGIFDDTPACVDKSIGTDEPLSTTSYIGSDEPVSVKSYIESDEQADDELFQQTFLNALVIVDVDNDVTRSSKFRLLSYDVLSSAAAAAMPGEDELVGLTVAKAKPKAKQEPKKAKQEPKKGNTKRTRENLDDILGRGEELEYAVGAASRGSTDDI